jgi:tRNA 2-thiouridine synthesizing protein C
MKTIVFIVDKPLHGNVCAQEFLDIAMMAAAFDQHVLIVFEGDGVYALMENQQTDMVGLKNVSPVLKALSIYDIDDVSVEKESMEARLVVEEQFVIPVKISPRSDLKERINSADHVFSF